MDLRSSIAPVGLIGRGTDGDRLGECGQNGLVAGELGHRHRLSCEGVGRVGIGEAGDTLGGC